MTNTVPPVALETLLAWLAHSSGQAAVLGLLVLLVSWGLRGRVEARWRYCLWLLVLVRLALPVIPPAPWSLFGLVGRTSSMGESESRLQAERPAKAGTPTRTAKSFPADHDRIATEVPPASVVIGAEVSPPHVIPEEPVREQRDVPLRTALPWLALAWLAGVLVLLMRQGRLWVRLHRQRRSWREASDPLVRDVLNDCRRELGVLRPVRLLTAAGGVGPATFGIYRASIVVPEGLLQRLSAEELRLVLLHELTHVRRRDVLLDRVAALLVAIHWFNPVAWLALARLRRERELACDAAVLRRLGEGDSGRYGHALLKVTEHLSAPAPLPGAVGVFGMDRSLVRRIHMIANFKKPTAAGKALGLLLLLVLGVIGLTDATAGPAPEADPEQAATDGQGKTATISAVAGVCRDEQGKPLPGVRVTLYREDHRERKLERLRAEASGDDGRFQFRELPSLPVPEERSAWGYALVLTKQGRGSIISPLDMRALKKPLQFRMRSAATLQGRVTDPNGKPIAGARVWGIRVLQIPVEGVGATRSDADGRYAITDMGAWGEEETKPRPAGNGGSYQIAGCFFDVAHPDYGHKMPMYRSIPATVDVVLQPAGVIRGRVIDQVTGKPMEGVLVSLPPTNANKEGGGQFARTNAEGEYRLTSVNAGTYNLWADAPDRVCTALDSFTVEAGKTHSAPDLVLVEGGWIEGQLVEAGTGKPISGNVKGGRMFVGLYGPARPKSGATNQASTVDDQGRFRLHVAPGVNFPYIMRSDYWMRTQRQEYFKKGIDVKPGEVVRIEFRILPTPPIGDPDPTPVRLTVPVPAERAAAALVRELGGSYKVDADNRVVEVSMVGHQTPDGRLLLNDRTDTDEALRAVHAFPRLKRLFLHPGQATDDGLRSLAGLKDLEMLLVWEPKPGTGARVGPRVTDAGVAHLARLPKLRELDLSNMGLGDASLAAFGRMPKLRTLGLQQNAFSDDGLKHLAGLKQLRSLSLGLNRQPLTDAGVRHLAGLTALERLDLQRSQLSDAGVAALKDMKGLRRLLVEAGPDGGSV